MTKQSNHNVVLDSFEEKLRKICDKVNTTTLKKNQLAYHYTNYKGLSGIIRHRKLWCTDYRKLADRTEVNYSNGIVLSAFRELNKCDLWEETSKVYKKNVPEKIRVYVCSFCLHDDYLPAWRLYSGNGTGFSRGFNFEISDEVSNERNDIPPITMTDITYNKAKFKNHIKELIELAAMYKNEHRDNLYLRREIDLLLISSFIGQLPCHKKKDFSVEKEVRLYSHAIKLKKGIWPEIPSEKFIIRKLPCVEDIPFLKKSYGKYAKRYCHDFEKDVLTEIRVGPGCEFEKAKLAIEKMLRKNDFDLSKVQIKKSNHSYG